MESLPEGKDIRAKDRRKHKGGAPKKTIKREAFIMVRLTATERMFIAGKAKRAGMKLSDWFRAAAKNAKVMERLKPEDRRILHMLTGAANNLNQLTRLAHTGGILSIARKCNELLIEIDQALKYLNADDRQDT
ncbi:plasmid mobilization protein [Mucilaginibacter sp. McL0603]|uniref:plasmid mobilization protein n=1 Tax=Mucilaginibacter sp. McL0603 TaxID=3415670 RepID=UPI003CE94A66